MLLVAVILMLVLLAIGVPIAFSILLPMIIYFLISPELSMQN